MKHPFLILSIFIALVFKSSLLQAAPFAVADTLTHYIIDNKPVEHFDGSQLAGKKILTYQISIVSSNNEIVRIHTIRTDPMADYAYVIDGNQVPKSVFEQLDANGIKSITIIKDGSRDDIDVKKYIGWENGVVLVETKKDGSRVFKNKSGKKK